MEKEKPTFVLEAVALAELRIWTCDFGKPGTLNDIKVLDSLPIVTSILREDLLQQFENTIIGRCRIELYFLVDGIYPPWSIFVSTIHEGTNC